MSNSGMRTYVFVGNFAQVLGTPIKLTTRGQRFEADEELAAGIRRKGGLAAIPAEEFDALGMTPEELKKWGPPGAFDNAPEEFKKKMLAAIQIWRDGIKAESSEGGN